VKAAAALLLLAASAAHAQMYKCTDGRGLVRYTDQAGAGCKEVAIRPSPPISGFLAPPADDLARQEAEFRRRQIDRDASVTQAREALLGHCVQLRREHGVLATSRRIVRMDEKGERQYMDDAVREQRLAELERELARCP
jgi:uncharacterized protein DUF4124